DAGGVEADAPTCSLCVSDRGPGIPETAAKRIFEPFVRLSERVDEGVSGTGLGLSIARELAEKMGGALLLLESESGAVFEFRLPVAPSNVVEMEGRKIS
ncbi:MAG: signal transduction histidine kinase, partial [Pseudoalteromonas tetraodonis]